MVIGSVNLEQFAPIISDLENGLNRPINYLIFTEEEWKRKLTSQDAFAMNVNQAAKIMLIGGEHAL